MISALRLKDAFKACTAHLAASLFVAAMAAALVFLLWYPYPYRELAGGRALFLLIVTVDVVCGPLLTAVLFNRLKPRSELWRDLSLIALVQLAALIYGLFVVWQARPLFLAHELDRFKVIMGADVDPSSLAALPVSLKPAWFSGPIVVALREPIDSNERNRVLFESVQGGRDYAERPEFYLPYTGSNALKSLKRARPLTEFLKKRPEQTEAAQNLASSKKAEIAQWLFLPVVARQDWVAVLDEQGQIQGFLKGDGF